MQFGENYELISLILPGRDRKACKNKFKAEDKRNPGRITYCLKNRRPYGTSSRRSKIYETSQYALLRYRNALPHNRERFLWPYARDPCADPATHAREHRHTTNRPRGSAYELPETQGGCTNTSSCSGRGDSWEYRGAIRVQGRVTAVQSKKGSDSSCPSDNRVWCLPLRTLGRR